MDSLIVAIGAVGLTFVVAGIEAHFCFQAKLVSLFEFDSGLLFKSLECALLLFFMLLNKFFIILRVKDKCSRSVLASN